MDCILFINMSYLLIKFDTLPTYKIITYFIGMHDNTHAMKYIISICDVYINILLVFEALATMTIRIL